MTGNISKRMKNQFSVFYFLSYDRSCSQFSSVFSRPKMEEKKCLKRCEMIWNGWLSSSVFFVRFWVMVDFVFYHRSAFRSGRIQIFFSCWGGSAILNPPFLCRASPPGPGCFWTEWPYITGSQVSLVCVSGSGSRVQKSECITKVKYKIDHNSKTKNLTKKTVELKNPFQNHARRLRHFFSISDRLKTLENSEQIRS